MSEKIEEWMVQFNDTTDRGMMINARGLNPEEAYANLIKARTLLKDGFKVDEEMEEPWYGSGDNMIEPYRKRSGKIGYKIGPKGTPEFCPNCKQKDFEEGSSQYGKYFACNNCETYINVREDKK